MLVVSHHHRWTLSLNKAMPPSSDMWLKDVLHDPVAKQHYSFTSVRRESTYPPANKYSF